MGVLNERLEFLLHVNAEGAIAGFEKTGAAAEHNLTKAEAGSARLGQQFTKVGAGMVVTGALIGAAMFEVSKKWEEAALSAGKLAKATNLTTEEASRWQVVAKGADVDTSALTTAMGKMDKAIEKTPGKFAELGAAIARTKSGAVDVQGTFLNVIDRFNATGGAAAHAATATALFGKGWQSMAELISKNSDELRASLAAVSDQQVFHADDVKQAEEYRATMKALGNAAQSLALALGKGAAPAFAEVASGATKAISAFTALNDVSDGVVGKVLTMGATVTAAVGVVSLLAGAVTKMKGSFLIAGEGAERGLTSVGKWSLGIGAAVLAVTAAVEVYDYFNEAQVKLEAHAKAVTASLESEVERIVNSGTVSEKSALAITALANALKLADGSGKDLAVSQGALGLSQQQLVDDVIALNTGFAATPGTTEGARGAMTAMVSAQESLANIQGAVTAALMLGNATWSDTKDEIAGGLGGYGKMTKAQEDVVHALFNVKMAAHDLQLDDTLRPELESTAATFGEAGEAALAYAEKQTGLSRNGAGLLPLYKAFTTALQDNAAALDGASSRAAAYEQMTAGMAGATMEAQQAAATVAANYQQRVAGVSLALQADAKIQDDVAAAAQKTADAQHAAAQAARDQKAAEDALYQSEVQRVDKERAFAEAQTSNAQAVADYNKLLHGTKKEKADAATQTEDLANKLINEAKQYGGLKGAADGSKEATKRQIDALSLMSAQLAPGSELRQNLDAYTQALKNIQRDIATRITLSISQGQVTTSTGDSGARDHGGVIFGFGAGDSSGGGRGADSSASSVPGGKSFEATALLWEAEQRAIAKTTAVVDDQAEAEAKKRADNEHQYLYESGQESLADYLAYLGDKLAGTVKYSDEWMALTSQMSQLNSAATSAAAAASQAAADAAAKAAKDVVDAAQAHIDEVVAKAKAAADLVVAIEAEAQAGHAEEAANNAAWMINASGKTTADEKASSIATAVAARKAHIDALIRGADARANADGYKDDTPQWVAAMHDYIAQYEAGNPAYNTELDAYLAALPKFHTGGVVPGRAGQEVPIMAQAGEHVSPDGGGNVFNVVIHADGLTEAQAAQLIGREFDRLTATVKAGQRR